mgnify:CR=1 FL=1
MEEPYWLPRTAEEYLQQVAEDSGPQPDETVLLQRDIDAAEAEVARLQALLAERDAEVARLVAAIQRHRPAERQPLRDVCDLCTNWWPCPTIQVLDAALAARGGES